MRHSLTLFAVGILIAAQTWAQEPPVDWTPPPPPNTPETWDWIQTTSGEWVKGELLVMYRAEVVFDSDEFDELTIDWDSIREVRTAGSMTVGLTGRRTAVGRLLVQDGGVQVIGDEHRTFGKDEVVSITAGTPREINYWDFDISVGATYRSGNTNQTETTSTARIRRRTVTKRLVFDWFAAYNTTDGTVAADTQRAAGTLDLFFSRRFFFTPVHAEWYRDPFQNIAGMYSVSVAVGYELIDSSTVEWQVSGGPGYALTQFDGVVEGESDEDKDLTFVVGTTYEHEISRRIDLLLDYRGTITSEASGRYLHHLLTQFEFELTRILDVEVIWVWDRIQNPRANPDGTIPEQDDNRLAFMFGVSF